MLIRRSVEAALASCLLGAKVPFTNTTVQPYNLRLPYTPLLVANPATTAHIEKAVGCAAGLGVKVNGRSGGHSYTSAGLGGENGHMVVDMAKFDTITVDPSTGVATVGTGSRLGLVATELYNKGRGLSHGSCPGVGTGGHASHGGWGTSSHKEGLTIDWMIGATVTLANGTTVVTSEHTHPDLLWAIRGAGSSVGIVSEMQFNTFAVPASVVPISITWDWWKDAAAGPAAAAAGLKQLQEWAANGTMPAQLWMNVFMTEGAASSSGMYWGTEAEMESVVKTFVGRIGGTVSSAGQMDWIDQVKYFSGAAALVSTSFPSDHDTFYASSLTTPGLTDAQLAAFTRQWAVTKSPTPATRSWWVQMDLHGGKSSAISRVPVGATAYPHRDKLLLWQTYDSVSSGPYPPDGFALMQNLQKSIVGTMPAGSWGRYANYPDSQVAGDEAARQYWGVNLPRLQTIKAAIDPRDVFYSPQGVRPAGASS